MIQLTIKTFPKYRPNITLQHIREHLSENIDYSSSNKEVRLAIDLSRQKAPMRIDHFDVIRSILQCDISNEKISAIKSFKQILYKKIIIYKNGKHQIAKVLRRRSK